MNGCQATMTEEHPTGRVHFVCTRPVHEGRDHDWEIDRRKWGDQLGEYERTDVFS